MKKETTKWIEAEEMISAFSNEFYDKFGVSITVHYNMKYRKVKKRINLRFVLDELNDYIDHRFGDRIFTRGFRNYKIDNGIFTKTRVREVVIARHIFCYIARQSGYGPSEIAQACNEYYDHSSVIHAVNKVQDALDVKDPLTVELYNYVLAKMNLKYDDKGSYSERSTDSTEE